MSNLTTPMLMKAMKKHGHAMSRSVFLNVYSRRNLPSQIKSYPTSFIINTDTRNLPGRHWVAIYINKQKSGEYFDSFGRPPSRDINSWLNRYCLRWRCVLTNKILQNPFSLLCGAYTLFYVNERPLVNKVSTLLRHFTTDPYQNDVLVLKYFQSTFLTD